jgi:hypothetical protein
LTITPAQKAINPVASLETIQNYHFVSGRMDIEEDAHCANNCLYQGLTALGDCSEFIVTGRHLKAEEERGEKKKRMLMEENITEIIFYPLSSLFLICSQ